MGQFVRGDVVVVNFPFSDLSQTTRRPALVIAALKGDDVILCQITSQARADEYSVGLDGRDFVSVGLNQSSKIRPNMLFTAGAGIVVYTAGRVSDVKLNEVVDRLIGIVKQA
ncbi:MAG: type II toxin-antitoxin system PemK/MazF family toxin [Bryobacteraceae bacterium]|nr:type II toxin-antitoxin system PemK/MazF family toxin [Bryobacteraceae bacterium]